MKRLARIQEAIAKVPEGGDWREARDRIAEETGGSEAQAENVLRTNAFQAYAAARYRSQMGDTEVFPYLKYVTVGDDRVRDSHARLNGTILRKDDPFWETHYPPWDWGCRCVAVELTEEMAQDEQAEGTGELRDKAWSEDYRAAHRGRDESKDYQFRPGSLEIGLDSAAVKGYDESGAPILRYDEETLRAFNERMEKAVVELPDGRTKNVREWMWEPVVEKAKKALAKAGAKDGREHAAVLDRNTGATIPHAVKKSDAGHVSIEYHLKAWQTVDVLHNHPPFDPSLSPQDVISAFDTHVREVGCTSLSGGMRLQVLSKDPRVLARVRRFDERLKAARTAAERRSAFDEWLSFVRAMNMTGVFKAEGLE
ncbi:MAG: minor capsid protein [Kiritimatiellae bacterium]|nr:minor capsid protein [Kiritimatiellia bacterium]